VIERADRVGHFDQRDRKAGPPEQGREARDRRGEIARHALSSV